MKSNKVFDDVFREFLVTGSFSQETFKATVSLSKIILFKYFSNYRVYWDDLLQESLLRVYDLYFCGHYNPNYSALNFVYTRIRNTMHNFLVTKFKVNYEVGYYDSGCDGDLFLFDVKGEVYESHCDSVNRKFFKILSELGVSNVVYKLLVGYVNSLIGEEVDDGLGDIVELDVDSYEEFKFYVNVYSVYFRSSMDESLSFLDIKDVLEYFSIVRGKGFLKALRVFFDDVELKKFFILFSGLSFRFPSLENLIEYQVEYNIYKDYKGKGMDYKSLHKKYKKSVFKIKYIVNKFILRR